MDTNRKPSLTPALASGSRVVIIGIYGISGAGKSYLLKSLERSLGSNDFNFYEGADEIAKLAQGGLQRFQRGEQQAKEHLRGLAIIQIREKCIVDRKSGVVAGHFMLWSEDEGSPVTIATKQDLQTFTHIIYLDIDPKVIAQRRRKDISRQRGTLSLDDLHRWQQAEQEGLRDACYRNGILFTAIRTDTIDTTYVPALLSNFRCYSEEANLQRAQARLHQIMALRTHPAKSVLVFDADRTLSAVDTGDLFWRHECERGGPKDSSLKAIFSSPLDYSHAAFRQAALLYHENYEPNSLDQVCGEIASKVEMYPEIESLLRHALMVEHAGAVVVTCGLQLVWEKILKKHRFEDVSVIGAGRLDDIIVDGRVKAALADLLRGSYDVRVTAFGDSPLDIQMLSRADRAVVVVGDEINRSKRMDLELGLAIHDGLLKAEQTVLSPGASPRLNTRTLPVVVLDNPQFRDDVFHAQPQRSGLRVIDTTNKGAAKILMTSMRDATMNGPALRKVHHRVGWYLATEVLPDVLGLEEYEITHVQGHSTIGHRIKDEGRTLIVALMRGGEPMALGVNEVMPSAAFLHAKNAPDVTPAHLDGRATVVLVDSVINNGDTMIDFVTKIHKLKNDVAVVMLAGVVQSGSIDRLMQLHNTLGRPRVTLVALRMSENKFTGRGGTDTGYLFRSGKVTLHFKPQIPSEAKGDNQGRLNRDYVHEPELNIIRVLRDYP